ncbi:serine/threonine-protein kinase [Nostoc sp. 2RC]|uniref:serine/threonine protein kinase n=1 Tax=Nostoc sp. 2RC TaxID=2485484 RepID=UPI0016270D9F|nr:serine/threonine-protein kinase [Nostoc sp. 2RC]MBC1240733.1 serine/threonine protein kinase [Nostoc sp. 2RC]
MPWIAGQQLQGGKYVIEQFLGQGGFGITYKALHVELNQTVVIKTPNEYLSHDPEYEKYIERFIQEGRILARLSKDPHPHIVGVIDLFRESATHCLVMDFVEGENLFEVVRRRGALPEAEIVPCIRQIGEALSVVHQAGLVHRDAHPGNIMVRRNGKAVLIDFGIAKELLPKTLSSTGNAGNHGFAPYEQMTRGSREPTVDVYCLAATLYYAVTGQNPTTSLARRVDDVPLTPPKQVISGISDQLNQAILKGMALEAKDRPQSMQAWLAMLEAPKVMPLLPIEPVHRTQIVHPRVKLKPEVNPNKPAIKLTKTIPWGWLNGSLVLYGLMGYVLTASSNPFEAVGGSVGLFLTVGLFAYMAYDSLPNDKFWDRIIEPIFSATLWSMVWTVAVTVVWVGILAVVWAGIWAGIWSEVGFGLVNWVYAVVLGLGGTSTMVWIVAADKLRKSFSKVDTFLILASTSSLGLGLGWLGHRIFNTGS